MSKSKYTLKLEVEIDSDKSPEDVFKKMKADLEKQAKSLTIDKLLKDGREISDENVLVKKLEDDLEKHFGGQ